MCGYKRCLRALSFHHLDPSRKDFSFGGSHNLAASVIKAELDKCACLCKNCHEEIEDALEWHPEAAILAKVKRVAAEWVAGEWTFSRAAWKEHHPAQLGGGVQGNASAGSDDLHVETVSDKLSCC